MIVLLLSVRGSPGVTSWSVLLGAAWPRAVEVERVILEADLAGGVLGARYELGVDPGVVSLLAALRRSTGQMPVEEHGRAVGNGLWLVPGPETAEQARHVWLPEVATELASRLAADRRIWLVDAGRLDATSPVMPLVVQSRLTLVLSRAAPEDLVQVPARTTALQASGAEVGALVVGRTPHPIAELAEFFGTSLVWNVDANAELPRLAGAVLSPGRARRSWLWRTAIEIAAAVAEHVRSADREFSPNGPARDELEVHT